MEARSRPVVSCSIASVCVLIVKLCLGPLIASGHLVEPGQRVCVHRSRALHQAPAPTSTYALTSSLRVQVHPTSCICPLSMCVP
eukprot:1152043-Pelagomonas_calceolata.AAC.3